MSTELQPRTRHRDVVGGTFALGFNKKRHICQVFSIPWSKRSKFLESVAVRRNDYLYIGIFFAWGNESLIFYGKALRWEGETCRRIEHHAVAILIQQGISSRIEVETARNGESHGELWTADEGKRIRVTISTAAKVSVERGNDGILARIIIGMTLPLSDARTAGIGHDEGSNLLEIIEDTITLGCIANLL